MKPLMSIKFDDLKKYLTDRNCFGFTASRRKHTIIYTFKRYFNSSSKLLLKIKVMRKSKYVMSVMSNDKVYTDFDELKEII